MLSALIPTRHSYPAVPMARQLVHQRSVHPGPLVLGTDLLNSPTPTTDRDRTVSRRSEPSSRTALLANSKPLGPTSAPGCDEPTSRCQTSPSMWTLGGDKPVIPGSFYPLSDGPTISTAGSRSRLSSCSTRRCRSEAPLCLYTLRAIPNAAGGLFERLRYPLGGDR